jgi:hypothetical protein
MATRSLIRCAVTNRFIYCHWDGYPDNNGKILNECYTNQEAVNSLIELGDLSSLGKIVPDQEDIKALTFNGLSMQGFCTPYTARGEELNIGEGEIPEPSYLGAEFLYTWDGQKWECTEY